MTAPGEPADAGRAGDELLDVVVIGASQAGLAMAWHLARHHLRFTVLEAGPDIGHTWRSRWDSLTLFTPAQYDALPGMPFPGPPDTYPAKDPVVGYLKAYAAAFDLPVRLNARVTELSRTAEGFEIRTGDGVLRARLVGVAPGPFQVPFTPPAAQRLDGPVTQLHSAGYRNPRALPPGPVLERRGARYTEQRVVERGKVITAAGVSAGIDMALTLLARLHGPELAQGLQLAIEYDPQPLRYGFTVEGASRDRGVRAIAAEHPRRGQPGNQRLTRSARASHKRRTPPPASSRRTTPTSAARWRCGASRQP